MQTTSVTLIRHGQTEWNRLGRIQGVTDIPLNDLGRAQAHAAAATLDAEYDLVSSSPLSRARETAQILADELGLELVDPVEQIIEVDFGQAEGADDAKVAQHWPDHVYPNAEQAADSAARGRRALDVVAERYPGKRVLVVSHSRVIRLTASEIRGSYVEPLANLQAVHFAQEPDGWAVTGISPIPELSR